MAISRLFQHCGFDADSICPSILFSVSCAIYANTTPSVLDDVTAGIVNGNYALDFGLKTDEAIYKDDVLDEAKYWNLIAARTADVNDPAKAAVYKKVIEAFQSDATEKVFNETFGGYFIKVGWDQDLLAGK